MDFHIFDIPRVYMNVHKLMVKILQFTIFCNINYTFINIYYNLLSVTQNYSFE